MGAVKSQWTPYLCLGHSVEDIRRHTITSINSPQPRCWRRQLLHQIVEYALIVRVELLVYQVALPVKETAASVEAQDNNDGG